MCGIAGILHFNGAPIDKRLLEQMTAALRHRGPDGGGYFLNGAVGLGNRRLSIIDLAGSRQPMSNESKTVWIVYNGEVYNFRELRRLLEGRGHRFRTAGDTEVIIQIYEEFGPSGVERLRGMFAFALWDAPRRRLLLARDQVGIKPLYYYQDSQRLAFASEIRPLLFDHHVPRRLSLPALDSFLSFSYVPGEETIFEGIRRLPPGHLMLCRDGRAEIRRYWHLSPASEGDGEESRYAAELQGLVGEAVTRHLVADVPVGVFLSGGLDSSSIVAVLARMGRQDTPTFSVGFADEAGYFNEMEDARRVAKHFGMNHHALVVRPNIADLLPRVISALEEPMGDPSAFLTYLISRTAREYVKVALTGIGGDELFAGYRRYAGARLVTGLRRVPRTLRDAVRRGAERIPVTEESRLGYHLSTFRRLLEAAHTPHPDAYIGMLSYFTPAMKSQLYTREIRAALTDHDPAADFRAHFARPVGGDLLSRISYLDLMTFLPDNLLLFSDKMSMAASLELRVPLLDLELVQFAAGLPSSLRLRRLHMKYLLRRAMAPLLPPFVLSKSKQGFSAPVGTWIRKALRAYACDLLSLEATARRGFWNGAYVARLLDEHLAGRREWGYQLFALMVCELWCRAFLDSVVTTSSNGDPQPVSDVDNRLQSAAGVGTRG